MKITVVRDWYKNSDVVTALSPLLLSLIADLIIQPVATSADQLH